MSMHSLAHNGDEGSAAKYAVFENVSHSAHDRAPISSQSFECFIVLIVVLVMPVALFVAQSGPLLRLLYPACNLALAAYLYVRRSPWYVGHCLLLFCFVSLVRRLVDLQAGWDPSNPVLLTPYLCCLLSVFSLLGYWSQPMPRYLGTLLTLFACIAYGVLLGVLNGRMFGSLVDALKWSVGPLFAVHVLAHRDQLPELRPLVQECLVWAGTAMAVYGIWQFIRPPQWDMQWMRDVQELGLNSIGAPAPFAVRVFSTMNSPGSFGIMLIGGVVFGLRKRLPLACMTVSVMIVGIALCLYRSIWAATALAVLMCLLTPLAKVRPANVGAIVLVLLAGASAAIIPQLHERLSNRASTLSSLENDDSLKNRLLQYEGLTRLDGLVLGEGLAINGASRRLDRKIPVHMDGAFIEIWRAMGVVVGTVFIACLGGLIAGFFRPDAHAVSDLLVERAVVVATFVQLPIGSVHTGELGFCAWMFLGFALASRFDDVRAHVASRRPPGIRLR